MRQAYHAQLESVNARLVDLMHRVTQMLVDAGQALLKTDLELAEQVVADDAAVDRARAEIDEQVIEVLATQAPVASELRTVVAALRITSDAERMGDHAVHIAKVVRRRYPHCAVPDDQRETLATMGRVAERIALKAVEAVRLGDVKAARELPADDDEMDQLHRSMFAGLLDPQRAWPSEAAVDLVLLGRYFERFADHAVLIGSHVIYRATGDYD